MPSHPWKPFRLTALPLVCLLAALPAPAAPTAAPAVPSQVAHVGPYRLFLKHITPDKILRELQWDTGGTIFLDGRIVTTFGPTLPQHPALPPGVESVYTVESENALLVIANQDGFNLVKQIVKNLDIVQQKVDFRVIFVPASTSEVEASGVFSKRSNPNVAQAYDALMKKPRRIVVGTVTSTTGIPASLDVDTLYRDWTKANIIPVSDPLPTDRMMEITSRVNADDTITFYMTWPLYSDLADLPVSSPASSQVLLVTRTVQNGGMLAMTAPRDISGALTANEARSGTRLIAFITPTILAADENPKTPPVPAPVGPIAP